MSLQKIFETVLIQAGKEGIITILLVVSLGLLFAGGWQMNLELMDLNRFQREVLVDEMIQNREAVEHNTRMLQEVETLLRRMDGG